MMLALHSRPMETSSPFEVLSLLWQLAQRAEVRKSSAGLCCALVCAREAGGSARRASATTWLAAKRALFIASSNVVHDKPARDEPSARAGRRRLMGPRHPRCPVFGKFDCHVARTDRLIHPGHCNSKYCVAVGWSPTRKSPTRKLLGRHPDEDPARPVLQHQTPGPGRAKSCKPVRANSERLPHRRCCLPHRRGLPIINCFRRIMDS